MEYHGERYLRLGKDNWFISTNESYEAEYFMEKELENVFKLSIDNLNI